MLLVGIDVGGTQVKVGLIENGQIIKICENNKKLNLNKIIKEKENAR